MLGLFRDAALELRSAERRKRVIEAGKGLVAKMNKRFVRTEVLRRDRFRSCFWYSETTEVLGYWLKLITFLATDPVTQSKAKAM